MTRVEYMNKLQDALKNYEDDFAADIMEDYKRHFDEATADGRSEESVCEELGNVEDFINDIPEEFRKKVTKASGISGDGAADTVNNSGAADNATADNATSGTENAGANSAAESENANEAENDGERTRVYTEDFDRITKEAEAAFEKAGKVAMNVASEVADNMGEVFTKLGDMLVKAAEDEKLKNFFAEAAKSVKSATGGSDSTDNTEDYPDDFESESYSSIDNPLVFGEYSDIENVCLNLIDADIEVRQSNSSLTTITLSRPLTKKEMMYYEIDQSVPKMLKISAGIRKGLNFNVNINSQPITFYVNLPYYCNDLALTTVSGHIETAGDLRVNTCKLASTSGSITSEFAIFAKDVVLETVSGRIGGTNNIVATDLKLKSVSGHINSRADVATFTANTVSGGIEMECVRRGNGKIDTVSGAIKVKLLSDIGALVNSSSMSGALRVITDKRIEWDGGANVAMMGIFNKGNRKMGFGEEGLNLKTNSISGSVKVIDYGKED